MGVLDDLAVLEELVEDHFPNLVGVLVEQLVGLLVKVFLDLVEGNNFQGRKRAMVLHLLQW
jgi:hypothetical protein